MIVVFSDTVLLPTKDSEKKYFLMSFYIILRNVDAYSDDKY